MTDALATIPQPITIGDPDTVAPEEKHDLQTMGGPNPGKYRVTVVRSKCISAGSCIAIAPKVFQFDQENIAKVISQDELDDLKLLAAQSCPTMAIIVEDIETGERVWPLE
jgi:ferredoxin